MLKWPGLDRAAIRMEGKLNMSKAKERIATEINKCVQITETISYCTW